MGVACFDIVVKAFQAPIQGALEWQDKQSGKEATITQADFESCVGQISKPVSYDGFCIQPA